MKDNESLDAATVITQIWEKSGAGGFFAGLGSRCVWAGAIIAGQFLLYEVFKGVFQVSHCTYSRGVVRAVCRAEDEQEHHSHVL